MSETLGFGYVSGRPPLIVIAGPSGRTPIGRTPIGRARCARCRDRVTMPVSYRTLDAAPSRICGDCVQAILR